MALMLAMLVVNRTMAATVSYFTTGVFSAGGTGGTVSGSGDSLTIGGSKLSFAGLSFSSGAQGFIPAFFGNLNLVTSTVFPSGDVFNGATFTLTVHQLLPTNDTGSTTAQILGTVNTTSTGAALITFTPGTFFLPGGLVPGSLTAPAYTVNNVSVPANGSIQVQGSVVVAQGTPNVVPLPSTALGSSALLGILALPKLRKYVQLA